ncbi:hypothetical protein ACXYMT_00595 [Salinimicrobium sp. CAU 1759]
MLKRLQFLAFLILFSACGSPNAANKGTSKEQYVLAYKKAVLYGCIEKATNGNFSEFTRKNNDLGLAVAVAVLHHSETQKARETGAQLSKKIKSSTYMDHEGRKPIFDQCVNFAFSNEMDSLALLEYRKFQKTEGKLFYKTQ